MSETTIMLFSPADERGQHVQRLFLELCERANITVNVYTGNTFVDGDGNNIALDGGVAADTINDPIISKHYVHE